MRLTNADVTAFLGDFGFEDAVGRVPCSRHLSLSLDGVLL
mgnify:CR=1 FL=1